MSECFACSSGHAPLPNREGGVRIDSISFFNLRRSFASKKRFWARSSISTPSQPRRRRMVAPTLIRIRIRGWIRNNSFISKEWPRRAQVCSPPVEVGPKWREFLFHLQRLENSLCCLRHLVVQGIELVLKSFGMSQPCAFGGRHRGWNASFAHGGVRLKSKSQTTDVTLPVPSLQWP